MSLDLRSEETKAALAIKAGDVVRYRSGRGHLYEAKVVRVPPEGQTPGLPPTLELEFRDERGKLQKRARSLHKSRSFTGRMTWETFGAFVGTPLGVEHTP